MFNTFFGTDPEIFVVDDGGNCVPPAALREDFGLEFVDEKTLLNGDEWSIIEDGAATEINLEPTDNSDVMNKRLEDAINGVTSFMKDNYNLDTFIFPTVPFDIIKYWKERGEEFKDCVRFGCDPDLDIYSGKYSEEVTADDVPERFGGGHIHMQAPPDNMGFFDEAYYHTTILLDVLVGNSAVAFKRPNREWIDAEKKRLKYYGRPGKIRLQEYPDGTKGIEYRTPSNFWITNPKVANGLLTLMNTVFNVVQRPDDASRILDNPWVDVAPNNISKFSQPQAYKLLSESVELLGKMRYLDYGEIASIVDLCI
jgi:hypothetical protein